MRDSERRIYTREQSVVFRKTSEAFGGLSNMASGYPLQINGVAILTSEALYQACRFPQLSEVQKLIIEQRSPMTAKMKSKPYRSESRPDWDAVRIPIMRWCLRVKLAQNWERFGSLLLATGEQLIVEESHRDAFWGATPADEGRLIGMNILGQLLMELRGDLQNHDAPNLRTVSPPDVRQFLLYDRVIGMVQADSPTSNVGIMHQLELSLPPSKL